MRICQRCQGQLPDPTDSIRTREMCDCESTSEGITPDQGETKVVAAVPTGSAWTQSGGVMRAADQLEELIQLRLECPGETRESALQWALDQRRRYTPNTKV